MKNSSIYEEAPKIVLLATHESVRINVEFTINFRCRARVRPFALSLPEHSDKLACAFQLV